MNREQKIQKIVHACCRESPLELSKAGILRYVNEEHPQDADLEWYVDEDACRKLSDEKINELEKLMSTITI